MSPEELKLAFTEVLQSCNFDVVYYSGDYLMARENPGQIPFAKLVNVEVLIENMSTKHPALRLSLVVKNEELPLQLENHCRQMFEIIQDAIAQDKQWELIEDFTG
jgi:hypothetical protein